MIDFASKRQFRPITFVLSLLLLLSLAISLAGNTSEADCDDDCRSESGACCECICCPNKALMTAFDEFNLPSELNSDHWVYQQVSLTCEQEWFVPIDHPPQNFS